MSCIPKGRNTMFNRKDDFNVIHPELQPGETFYTNVGPDGDLSKYSKQATRFGKQAYTTAGKKTDGIPVFKRSPTKIDMLGSNIPYQKIFLKITSYQDALNTLEIFKKDNSCKTCENNQCIHSGIVMNNLCLYHTNGETNTYDSLKKERGALQ